MGRGGSSSGSTMDYGLRGPEFDSHWELGLILLSSLLFPISISGAPLISSLTEVQHYLFSIFQVKNGGLAVKLEVKQA